MLKIGIIGGNSFIARHFFYAYRSQYSFVLFSRSKLNDDCHSTVLINDYFNITSDDLQGIDVVINFAAIVHQPKLVDENLYYHVNSELPIHLANESRKSKVRKFIQFSTVAVYGNAVLINNKTAEKPNNLYGKSKLKADRSLLEMNSDCFNVSILRPSMVYGADAPGNLSSLVRLVKIGLPVPFKGVDNKRQFVNVANVGSVLETIIEGDFSGVAIVADSTGISTTDLVDKIYRNLNKRNRSFYFPLFWPIVKLFLPSVYKKLCGQLEISPTINLGNREASFDEGLKQQVNSFLRTQNKLRV